jgi:hypothetical protein
MARLSGANWSIASRSSELVALICERKLSRMEPLGLCQLWTFVFEVLDRERVAAFQHLDARAALLCDRLSVLGASADLRGASARTRVVEPFPVHDPGRVLEPDIDPRRATRAEGDALLVVTQPPVDLVPEGPRPLSKTPENLGALTRVGQLGKLPILRTLR